MDFYHIDNILLLLLALPMTDKPIRVLISQPGRTKEVNVECKMLISVTKFLIKNVIDAIKNSRVMVISSIIFNFVSCEHAHFFCCVIIKTCPVEVILVLPR